MEIYFGLNYKYRDPVGVRAELQSFVDPVGSRELHDLERHAQDKLRHFLGSALGRTFSNLQTSMELHSRASIVL